MKLDQAFSFVNVVEKRGYSAAPDALRDGLLAVAARDGFWLGARAVASHLLTGGAMVEVVVGDAADGWADAEALQALRAALG